MRKNKLFYVLVIIAAVSVLIFSKQAYDRKIDEASIATTAPIVEEESVKERGAIVYSPMGDSLTDGYFASSEETKFTSVFARMLEDEMGYAVSIDGVSKYGGLLERGVEAGPIISEKNPNIVTIEYGTNDADPNNGEVTPNEFESQLNELIDTLYENEEIEPIVVLVTTWNQGDKSIPFDDVIKKVGKERNLPVADISDIWKRPNTKGPAGVDTYLGTSDEFHPNDKGMKAIAEVIFDVASPYLD